MKLFSQINSHISAILNPTEILTEVVNLIANAFSYYYIQVYQVDETDPTCLVSKNEAGLARSGRTPLNLGDRIPLTDETIVGWVANHRRLLCVNDIRQEARYRANPNLPRTRAEIALPIRAGDTIFGVLDIQHDEADVFDEDDTFNLQALVDQLAVAVQNARLFDEVLQRERLASVLSKVGLLLNETLDSAQIAAIICHEAVSAFQVDSVFLWLVEKDHVCGVAGSGRDADKFVGQRVPLAETETLGVRVVQSRQAEFINEIDFRPGKVSAALVTRFNVRAILGVPLIAAERVLGAIMLLDCENPNRFNAQDLVSASLLANQAAIALDNARLFEEERRRTAELDILNQIGQAINATTDLTTLMNVIHEQVGKLMPADNMFIALHDVETDTITFPLARGGPGEIWESRTAGKGITEHIIAHKRPLLLRGDVAADLVELGIEQIGQNARSWLGVPMIFGDTVLGVIGLQDYERDDAFSENDLNILSTIAAQAAISLQNIHLLHSTQTQAQEMHQLYELGVSISQEFDLNQILKAVICEALTLTGRQWGTVWVWDEGSGQYLGESVTSQAGISERAALLPTEPGHLVKQVIDRGELLVINEAQEDPRASETAKAIGIVASVGVPIKIEGQTMGAMVIHSLSPYRFTERDFNLLQFLVTQAAVAIRNAQLVDRLNKFSAELEQRVEERTEELRQQRDRVDTLYHIARQLSSSLDLDRVLNEALHLLDRAIDITQGSILLITPATDHLVYRAALGRGRPLPRGGKETRYKIGVGLAGYVLETREPYISGNLSEDAIWLPDNKPLSHRSVLATPLITAFDALGVLMLFHDQEHYFTENHLALVTAAAPMIATAISNADLYTLITEQAERVGNLLRTVQAEDSKNKAIIEGIADGVLVIDADHTIQLVNSVAARMLGTTKERLMNQTLDIISRLLTAETDRQIGAELYKIVTTQENKLHQEATKQPLLARIDVDGKAIVVLLTAITFAAHASAPPSTLVVLRDISREAELDRIKDEFISTVSHELRTPMTPIKGYTDLLIQGKVGPLDERQRRFLQIIKSNADRLDDLVNDILDISRLDADRVKLDRQVVDLAALVHAILPSFEYQLAEKNLTLTLDIPAGLPPAYADPDRVTQILVNLISNGTKYTRMDDKIDVRVSLQDEYLRVDVRDTGLGISAEDQKHVFERFFRAERDASSLVDGTGLGLPIAKMFVELMGGEIWVESELGAGSTFSFTLPIAAQAVEAGEKAEAPQNTW